MQASTSHAVLGQAVRNFAASKLLPPCTCRARLFSSLDTPSRAEADVPEGPAENTLRFANTKPRRVRNIPTHADRLAAREEKKSTVFLDGLSPWVTPNDVRRLLEQRLVPLRNVVEGSYCRVA